MLDRLTLYNELKDVFDPAVAEKLADTLFRIFEEMEKSLIEEKATAWREWKKRQDQSPDLKDTDEA
jgi:hypothetical protein